MRVFLSNLYMPKGNLQQSDEQEPQTQKGKICTGIYVMKIVFNTKGRNMQSFWGLMIDQVD